MNKNILIAFLSFILLSSCQIGENKKSNGNFPITYEKKFFMIKDESCSDTADKCTKLDLEYFEFAGTRGYIANLQTSQMIEYISGLPVHDSIVPVENTADTLLDRYRKFKNDFPDSKQYWPVIMKSEISYNSDKLLCIEMVTGSYHGGAHGDFRHSFLTINNAGDRVHVIDLVTDIKKFAEIAEENYRKNRGIGKNQSLNIGGYFFPQGKFILPEGIGLNEKGFVLYYNVYEIAPFFVGGTELIVDFKSLEGILKKPFFQ